MSPEMVTHAMTQDQREEIPGGAASFTAPGDFLRVCPWVLSSRTLFRNFDVAVFVDERLKGLRTFYELNLEEELEKNLQVPFPVDVRVLNGAPLSFQYKAIRGRLLLDRAPQTRVDFGVRVMSRYFDIRPLLVHSLKEAFGNGTGP